MTEQKRSLAQLIAERKAAEAAKREELAQAREELTAEAEQEKIAAPSPIENPTTPSNPEVLKKLSLKELLAQKRGLKVSAEGEGRSTLPSPTPPSSPTPSPSKAIVETVSPIVSQIAKQEQIAEAALPSTVEAPKEVEAKKETFSLDITLNARQLMAKEMAFAGKSFCLVGAAGTGKTTAQREVARALLSSGKLSSHSFRIQGSKGEHSMGPSIAFVAYTRVASGNLRRAIHRVPELEEALVHNVTTIHNLLEYTPETYWCYEENKEKFRFTPLKHKSNPLDITHLVIEEASMVGLDLWEKLYDAMRCGVQIIFIGDINQLPPVFGPSILNYALCQLPVIELNEVYRQAEDSSILANAHRILKGEMIVEAPDFRIVTGGTVNHTQAKLAATLGMTFPKWAKMGEYDPNQDIILSPWNKRDLGTDNMNKWIAQFLGQERGATVHEVIAGVTKLYLAEGDKVMFNKRVGVITKIALNGNYMGRAYMPASVNLNRFGCYTGMEEEAFDEEALAMDYSNLDLDKMLETEDGDRTKEASHIVTILMDDGDEEELTAIGDYSPSAFSLAYALTVHKAQGCEWRKVYGIMHRDHSVSLCRELFYTMVTRAREQFVLIAKPNVIEKAIATQRIKGNTTAEKIEYFNSGITLANQVFCTK